MIDRAQLTVTSREQLRREIAQQTESFLRHGGSIDVLYTAHIPISRPVGSVWWEIRGSGSLLLGS